MTSSQENGAAQNLVKHWRIGAIKSKKSVCFLGDAYIMENSA
jgi:hypothetical protein